MGPTGSRNQHLKRNQPRPAKDRGQAAGLTVSPAIQALYAAATQHLQAGRRDEAERLLEQVLAAAPRHADSLHLLGVVAYQMGRLDLALEQIGRAIAINPGEAQYHSNLGNLLQQKGRLDEAVASYRTAIDLNPDLPGAHNNLGNALREQGLLDAAAASYRKAIVARADYAEAHNNLGVALLEQGRPDDAIASYRKAIELRPNYPDAYNNLGNALRERWLLDEAVASYRKALELRPDFPEAHNNLGIALQDQGRPDDAVAAFRTALDLNPGDPDTHINLGLALKEQGRLDEAAACCDGAIDLKPNFPEAHYNRGNVRQEQGRLDEAIASYRRALELRPDYAGAHVNLGNALRENGLLVQAVTCYRKAIDVQPDYSEAHHNLGIVVLDQGRPDQAVACGRRAIALRPDYTEAHDSLGNALRAQGSLDAAIASYRRAIELKPDNADAHSNLAMALLAQGDLAAGWEEYEWRWKTPQLAKGYRGLAQPQWRGEQADGRTLLIHAEQGFGDTIQFCRYAPLAAARGLRVVLEVPKALVRLLRSLPGVDRVVAHGEALPPFDLHCPMLTLPLALGTTTLAAVPGTVPYLHADAALAAAWRDRLAALGKPGVRVGLVWAGNPRKQVPGGGALDRRRSIPPDLLAPLFELPGLHVVSLQKEGPALPSNLPLTDLMGDVGDFADTAALIANLDLVIAVDTSVAHLAAALGKPVWLLDRFDPCWRWLIGRRDSPWYPTLTLFRQPALGDWQTVIDSVKAELASFVTDHAELASFVTDHGAPGSIVADRMAATWSPDTVPLGAFTDIQGLFADAVRQHRAGRLTDAERHYRQVLEANPRHADSLHLLGVIGGQTGHHDLAADMISRAIAINPNDVAYHCNLGIALKQLGQLDEAIASFRTALRLRPDNAEAHNNLGIALGGQARPDDAIACFRKAIELDPNYLGAHTNLGNALKAQGRLDEAVVCYRRAVELDPNRPGAHNNLGTVLREQGQFDAAVGCFRRALELDATYVLAHNSLGIAFKEQARLDEAAGCFRQALDLSPDFSEAHNNLGTVLGEQARQDEAIACYRKAIELSPAFAEAYNNLGTALRAQQLLDEAAASYRRAIEHDPEYADAHNNLAMTLLAQGDLAAGWPEYEWRWKTAHMTHSRRNFAQPQWRGEPAEGRTLLIHGEQGLGDTLHFCRYAPLATARGLRVILEVPSPLVRLLRSLPGIDQVVARGEALPPFDLHCPMLSLPLTLGTTMATIPNAVPYLHADAAEVAAWGTRLAALHRPGRRVGLVWAGNSRRHSPIGAALDGRRSIAPEQFAPLLAVPGLHFVSLQKDGPAAPAEFGLTDLMAAMVDFADTAALIANLDLVVSVDTSVAHLAAALGKPVWLLDRFDPDWRWLIGRRDSPWYPTLTLFRQPEPGNWPAVIATVQAELGTFASGASAFRLLPGNRVPSAGAPDVASARPMSGSTPPSRVPAAVPTGLLPASVLPGPKPAEMPPSRSPAPMPPGLQPPPMSPSLQPTAMPDVQGLFATAVGHHRAGRLADAEPLYRKVLAANPHHSDSLYLLGVISGQRSDPARAAELISQAIAINPAQAAYHTNLGVAFREQERLDEAAACFRAALDLKPDDPEALNTLGVALKGQGRLDEAIACYRRAIDRRPDYPEAHRNLAIALLASGDLAAGWQEFEWRWQTPQMIEDRRDFAQPQWRGEPAEGRTLLIHAEQGFGDTLQFCRFAPLVAARGLRVILEAPQPLVRLLQGLAGIDQVVPAGDALPESDLHCPMLSLPLALETTLATIPNIVPYLHVDLAQVAAWQARLTMVAGQGLRVGVAWAGNPLTVFDRRRSLAPSRLAPLFPLPGAHFFSLQKDSPAAPEHFPLIDFMAEMGDFADTAALIANLDLVVTVDNAIAHLAGALGKPVWLLDRFDPDWRWLAGRRDSPWYPTLRIFRQPQPGDWDTVIDTVRTELRAFVAPRSPATGTAATAPDGSNDTPAIPGYARGQPEPAGEPAAGRGPLDRSRHDAAIQNNCGTALQREGRLDEAIACYRRAIDCDPDLPDAHSNLGAALRAIGLADEAVACYRQAIALKPDYSEAHNNLGIALQEQGLLDAAVACFREAIALKPDYPDGHGNLAMALLLRGDLPEGWAEYEWRSQTPQMLHGRREFAQPRWRGAPAEGRTLLVHAEQGFGDTLQFCRYVPLAAARGLRVVLEAPGPLVRLLHSLPGVDRVVAWGDELPSSDLHCPMLSLPLAFGTTIATIPNDVPYLHAEAARVADWQARLAAVGRPGPRIGLVWAGNPRKHLVIGAALDRRRSIAPDLLAPLFELPALHFVSLQKDGPAAPGHFPLTDFMAEVADFADTAALVANLDLVISVDTSVAHLAAALGKPVWLLDRFDPCWRWLVGRSDSPWYPALRIFRQPRPGDWDAVLAEVVRRLCEFVGD